MLTVTLQAQVSPLPPLNSNPLWEIKITGQVEGVVTYDTLTYGQRYCRCEADYVAIILNEEEEVMYMRQTEEQAFYLTDINDCSTERLLYDYSTNNPQIPIENLVGWTDSLDLIDFAVSSTGSLDGLLQLPSAQFDFNYPLGPFTLSAITYWIRGVGDINHPLFPIYNNLDGGISERSYSLERLTVDHIIWYETGWEVPEYPIIYVDKDAENGLQDGSSWSNAFTDLSMALQLADPGDLVWVAEGIYKPASEGDTDRAKVFELRDGIQLYGGFSGTETYLSDRNDPQLHPTVLSGDIGVLGDSTDNSFHILRIQDVMDFVLLDGFTISEGNAMGGDIAFPFTENGAGILIYAGLSAIDSGQIILKNNVLTGHAAFNGAAISLADAFAIPLRLSINNCLINDNYAQQSAGGLYVPFSLTQALDISISETDFAGNRFRNLGGGAIFDYHSLTNWNVTNTTFHNNGTTIGGGGGAWAIRQTYGDKQVAMLNTSFRGNYCVGGGGGFEYFHEGVETSLSISLNKIHFENNRSFANDGAGISIVGTHYFELGFSAVDCVFKDNQSVTRGGAIYAALDGYEAEGDFMFDRCLFSGNESAGSLGGGMRFFALNPNDDIIGTSINIDVQNSLFIKNRGVISQGVGSREAAIFTNFTNCTLVDNGDIILSKSYNPPSDDSLFRNESYLKNTIIWEPDLPLWQILYNGNPEDNSVFDYELDHCLISVDSCDLPGGEEACQSYPNFFNVDPLFVDTTLDDFRLKNCSPLLNQGINWPEVGDYDLTGQKRVLEEIVDVGAYETNTFAVDVDSMNLSLLCAGDSTGSLAVNTINSSAPVHFTLVHQNGNTSNMDGQFDQLGTGTYQLFVADAQSCADTLDFVVTAPSALALYTSVEHYMDENQGGTIFLDSIVGGTPPYQTFFEEVAWGGEPLEGLSMGTYLLSVIDGQGCRTDSLIEITVIDNVADQIIKSPNLVVSPNPVSIGNDLNIIVLQEQAQLYQLEIWSAQGTPIFEAHFSSNDLIDSFIPNHPGLFFLVLKDRKGLQLAIHKLIVQ